MRTADVDDFGDRVAALLRQGSRKQFDEVQKLVLEALQSGERINGDMIMEIIWSLLPKRAQKTLRREEAAETRAPPLPVGAHHALEGARLRKALREELAMSEVIVRDGQEVIPRFRIFTPEGQFVILVPFVDETERRRRLQLVGLFMAWKLATAFVISGERHSPDSVSAFAVTRGTRRGLARRIERGPPLSFAAFATLAEADIEAGLTTLLPRRETRMTLEMVAELERVFGHDGEMPAMRVG